MTVVDPLVYYRSRAEEASISTPVRGESGNARVSLTALLCLINDCPLFYSLTPRERRSFTRRWSNRIIDSINNEGFIEFSKRLAVLGNTFLRCFIWRGSQLTFEFDAALTTSPILTAIVRLTKLPIDDLFFNTVRWIFCFHVLLAKAPLTRTDLLIPSESDWIKRQSEIKDINDMSLNSLEALQFTVGFLWDKDFPTSEKCGKHGPGSTNLGVKDIPSKENLFSPSIQSQEISKYDPRRRPYVISTRPENSKLELVPKDVKSLRPITMESISMQFSQQALKRIFYRYIDGNLVPCSAFVRFRDQLPSQRLALLGSSSGLGDRRPITVDLSSASDLLNVDLISAVFPSSCVHEIMCARTWEVDTSQGPVAVQMYAGMGSAVTFPIQSIIFTAISLMAVCKSLYIKIYGYDPGYVTAVHEFLHGEYMLASDWKYFKNVRVYGDDIIVPQIATAELYKLLKEFGLLVNTDKSFDSDFAVREACGIFALAGVDITPLRYRIPIYNIDGSADFSVYEAYRNFANHSFFHGYRTLYRFAVDRYESLRPFWSKRERVRSYGKFNDGEICHFTAVRTLFEEFDGDSKSYIGIVSSRPIYHDIGVVFGEEREVITTLSSTLDTDISDNDEYHYMQALYMLTYDDILTESHGRIPRGIRLHKRLAYLTQDKKAWAWAPKWVS